MRRRLIIALVLTLLVAVPAAPAVLGWYTEDIYTDIITQVSGDNPELDVQLERYDRGWLGARAEYTVTVTGPWADLYHQAADTDDALEIQGRDRIRHGPWLGDGIGAARFDSELRMHDALTALGHEEIAGEPILHARSRIDARGHVDSRFHIPDYHLDLRVASTEGGHEEYTLEWRDAGGRAGLEGETSRVLLHAPELNLTGEDGSRIRLRDFEIGDRSRRTGDGLWLGRMHVAIGEATIAVDDPEQPLDLHLTEFTMETRTDLDGDHAAADMLLAFDGLTANGTRFDDADIRARFHNLEREPLARLNRLINQAQGDVDDGGLDPAFEAELRDTLDALLRGSPEMHSERIHIGTGDGPITGDVRLSFDGTRPFRSRIPITLIDPLAGHLELRFPRELLRRSLYSAMADQLPDGEFSEEMETRLRRQVDQSINILVAMGLIDREDDQIVLRVDKETGGPPLVNDQDIMAMIEAIISLLE